MIKIVAIIIGLILGAIVAISVIRLLLLRKDVGQFRDYWAEQLESVSGEIVYIALGDSAAQGIGAQNPEHGYVGLVADYVAQKTGKKVAIYNISVSGATTTDATQEQIPRLAHLPKPDIITIDIGANDVPEFNEQQFKHDFRELLQTLPNQTIVANIPSFANGIYNHNYQKWAQAFIVAIEKNIKI